jgi:catechol 2,3-dioxygenase-like lactoylglutathione lyase family enzyme
MARDIEALVADYDRGKIDRRQFIRALSIIAAATGVAKAGTFQATSLNHVTLAVSDVERSRQFYESVLGASAVSKQENGINLGLGESFLGLYDIPGPPRIHHFCVGVDGYEIQAAAQKLRQAGIAPTIRQDRPELYFSDPDGVLVQLSEKEYRG